MAPSRRRQNGGEVAQPEQRAAGVVHGGDVEGARRGRDVAAQQRRDAGGVVAEAVGVAAAQRGEPGVEAGRGDGRRADADVRRQHAAQPAQQRDLGRGVGTPRHRGPGAGGDVEVADLSGGMHARVGAAGDDEAEVGRRRPQHGGERLAEDAGDGPSAGLLGPAGEVRAVVLEVEPEPRARRTRRDPPRSAPRSEAPGGTGPSVRGAVRPGRPRPRSRRRLGGAASVRAAGGVGASARGSCLGDVGHRLVARADRLVDGLGRR